MTLTIQIQKVLLPPEFNKIGWNASFSPSKEYFYLYLNLSLIQNISCPVFSSLLHIWVYIYEGNLSYGKRNGKTCMTIINLDGHQSFSCRMWLSSSSLPQLLKMVWRIIILVFYGCAKTSISGWEIVLTQSERLSFMK